MADPLTTFEQTQLDSLWQIEQSYFAQFQNLSLPLGGLSIDDYKELYHLVAKNAYNTGHNVSGIKIADVGAWTGLSSLLFASIASPKGGKVLSVDWFQGSEATNLSFAGKYFNIKRIFLENIKQFEYSKVIEILEGNTAEIANRITNETLDVVFLDADHRYDYVKRDIQNWLPKVKKGGLLCGHDCEFLLTKGAETIFEYSKDKDIIEALHIGVGRALYELLPQAQHTHSGKIWFYKRPQE